MSAATVRHGRLVRLRTAQRRWQPSPTPLLPSRGAPANGDAPRGSAWPRRRRTARARRRSGRQQSESVAGMTPCELCTQLDTVCDVEVTVLGGASHACGFQASLPARLHSCLPTEVSRVHVRPMASWTCSTDTHAATGRAVRCLAPVLSAGTPCVTGRWQAVSCFATPSRLLRSAGHAGPRGLILCASGSRPVQTPSSSGEATSTLMTQRGPLSSTRSHVPQRNQLACSL